jgi:hypothetical protein
MGLKIDSFHLTLSSQGLTLKRKKTKMLQVNVGRLFLFPGTAIFLIAILILPAAYIWHIEKRTSPKCRGPLSQAPLS